MRVHNVHTMAVSVAHQAAHHLRVHVGAAIRSHRNKEAVTEVCAPCRCWLPLRTVAFPPCMRRYMLYSERMCVCCVPFLALD